MASERTPLKTVAALALAGLLFSPAARAEPTPADRETARHLMKIGDEKLAAKVTLTVEAVGLRHDIRDEIELG